MQVKPIALTLIPLLLLATLFPVRNGIPPVHAQGGIVCIAETAAVSCPATPITFTGALTSPVRTQLRIEVFLQDSPPMNGFNIILLADSTILQPADADLTGSLVGVVLTSPTILAKCIGGVLVQGSACDARALGNPNTLQFAAVGSGITPSPTTGLLFTAVYNIVAQTSAPITIGYQTGCSGTSVPPDTCITVSDGTLTPVPQIAQVAAFHNAVQPPFVTLSASPTSIGPIFPGDLSTFSTITITSNNGFESSALTTVSLTAAVTGPVGLSASIAPGFVDLSGVPSATSTLTVSATTAVAPGTYSVTVIGTYQVQDAVTLVVSTLSHSVTLSIAIVDFNFTADITTVPFWIAQTGTAMLTISPLNGFTGTVSITTQSVTPATTPALTVAYSSTSITGGSGTSTATFSDGVLGAYTVTTRGTSTLSGFNRFKQVVFTVQVQDFDISSSTSTVTFDSGSQGTATLTLTSLPASVSGFSGSVDLSASVTPTTPALTVTFGVDPVALAAGGTAASAITFSATVSTQTTYTVVITGTGSIGSSTRTKTVAITVTVNPSGPGPDFTITADPTSVTVLAGETGTSTITVTSVNSFTGTVSLSHTISPVTGLTCTLNPTSVTLGTSVTSTLSCSGSPGTYTITVTGIGDSLTRSTLVTFIVTDFAVAADPTIVSVATSAEGTSTITITALNGFTGTVNLSDDSANCALAPASVTLPPSPETTTLSCTFSSVGNHTVTVTGTSGSLTRSTVVTFRVGGIICIAETTSVGCPAASITFTGTVNSQLRVAVLLQNSPPTNGFNIILLADSGILKPVDADITGTILFPPVAILVKCVGGVLVVGSACDARALGNPDTLQFTAAGNLNAVPNGLLFTAIYDIVGTTSGPITIRYQTGCTATSNPPSCVTLSDGTITPVSIPHLQPGSFDNTVLNFEFTLNPASIASAAPGASVTSTITITPLSGFTGDVTLSTPSASAGLTATINPASVPGASGTATLTVSLASTLGTGTYDVTVRASGGGQVTNFIFRITVTVVHDVAVTSVQVSTDRGTVGVEVTFTIVVQNKGTVAETVTVSAVANNITVESQNVTLAAGASQTVTLTWKTAGYAPATYELGAKVMQLSGETSTADNIQTSAVPLVLSAAPSGLDTLTLAIIGIVVALIILGLVLFLRRTRPAQPRTV